MNSNNNSKPSLKSYIGEGEKRLSSNNKIDRIIEIQEQLFKHIDKGSKSTNLISILTLIISTISLLVSIFK